ncbi:MAG: hypothetical protein KDK29_18005 [Sedimentitalea sp.]|nr:hypothetical protein [Sedimentitalea sp.]
MSAGAERQRPPPELARHRIGECIAAFHVASARGPLASPDRILSALRQELLPALDALLHDERLAGASAEVPRVEIDLGDWPEDPDWSALRDTFRDKLESALAPFLTWPETAESGAPTVTASSPAPDRPVRQVPDPDDGLADLLRGPAEALHAHLADQLSGSDSAAGRLRKAIFEDARRRAVLYAHQDAASVARIMALLSLSGPDPAPMPSPPPAVAGGLRAPDKSDSPAATAVPLAASRAPDPVAPISFPAHDPLARVASETGDAKVLSGLERLRTVLRAASARSSTPDGSVARALEALPDAVLARLHSLLFPETPPRLAATRDSVPQIAARLADIYAEEGKNEALRHALADLLAAAGHPRHTATERASALAARLHATSVFPRQPDMGSELPEFGSETAAAARSARARQPDAGASTSLGGAAEAIADPIGGRPTTSGRRNAGPTMGDATPARAPSSAQPIRSDGAPPRRTAHDWVERLASAAISASDVRAAWRDDPGALSQAIEALSEPALANWIDRLGPTNAPDFATALQGLRRAARPPEPALALILRALLADQPIDFDAARRAAAHRGSGPQVRDALAQDAPRATAQGAIMQDLPAERADRSRSLRDSEDTTSQNRDTPGTGAADTDAWSRALAALLATLGHAPEIVARAFGPSAPEPEERGQQDADALPSRDGMATAPDAVPLPDPMRPDALGETAGAQSGSGPNPETLSTGPSSRSQESASADSLGTKANPDRALEARAALRPDATPEQVRASRPPTLAVEEQASGLTDSPDGRMRSTATESGAAETTRSEATAALGPDATPEQVRASRPSTSAPESRSSDLADSPDGRMRSAATETGAAKTTRREEAATRQSGAKDPCSTESPAHPSAHLAPPVERGSARDESQNTTAPAPDQHAEHQPRDTASDPRPLARRQATTDAEAALVALRPTLEALLGASLDPARQDWRAALNLVWSALPNGGGTRIAATGTPPGSTRTDPTQAPDPAAGEPAPTAPHPDPARDSRYWQILLRLGAAPRRPDDDLAGFLDRALRQVLPDPDRRTAALRVLIARLGHPGGGQSPALRRQVREALQRIVEPPTRAESPAPATPATPEPRLAKPHRADPASDRRHLTARAGLVLLHPFLALLFTRLDVLDAARRIVPERLLRARAALQMITDQAPVERPTDPLEKLLLGLPQGWTHPGTVLTDLPDPALIDGLLRAVIDRWGALGQTSPEGLREAFLRRGGTLQEVQTGTRLRIDPGPYDMLFDRLPWSFATVALPWMDKPCHVTWRGGDD